MTPPLGLPLPSLPTPPLVGRLRRTAGAVWTEGTDIAQVLVGFLRTIPTIAVSLERLADLQDELEALSKLDFQLERLADLQDELSTLGRLEHALERIAEFGTPLDNLTEPVADLAVAARSLPELSVAAQSLPELVTQVRLVESIVERMDARLGELTPKLDQIADFGMGLGSEIDDLGDALAPISRIASRLPGGRRRQKDGDTRPEGG
jgi:methyl-accepting chemotaxis protein